MCQQIPIKNGGIIYNRWNKKIVKWASLKWKLFAKISYLFNIKYSHDLILRISFIYNVCYKVVLVEM